MLRYHPPGSRHPPKEQTPPEQTSPPPREQYMLGDTCNKQAVRVLLECILVVYLHSTFTNPDSDLDCDPIPFLQLAVKIGI